MSNMVVRTNIFSLNAHRNMKNVGLEQRRASNRLSSGYRINSAADDAAGLAISETMRAQIRGLDQASRNAQDGQAMLLTTEGGLEEIGNMLQRTRELLVQAANDTNTQDQRTMIEQEISQLGQEIASMQQRVEFNTNRVLAMGPALPQEINTGVAQIEADSIRVSEAFGMLDANRQAAVDAREMLNSLDGTITFDQLNQRQQAMVERALGSVNLDEVTGGTNTSVTTNIPGNIVAVSPMGVTPPGAADAAFVEAFDNSPDLRQAVATWNALEALRAEHAAATQAVTDAGTDADELAIAQARLARANDAIDQAGFDNVAAVTTARDALGGTDGVGALIGAYVTAIGTAGAPLFNTNADGDFLPTVAGTNGTGLAGAERRLEVLQVHIDEALGHVNAGRGGEEHTVGANGDDVTWGERLGDLMAAFATQQGLLATAQGAYDTALENMQNNINTLVDNGLQVTGNTVTDIIGALNARESTLADRTDTLNQVRAEMLLAAEVQFDVVRDFASAPTSGNFEAFFQVGANQNQGISYDFERVSRAVSAASAVVNITSILVANPGTGGGVGRGIEVSPLIQQIQASLDDINTVRANLGAVQNRMDYTMRSLDISSENLQDSESRVRNADMAREMMRFTMSNVLQQASISMLSQANQMPNNLLQVLR